MLLYSVVVTVDYFDLRILSDLHIAYHLKAANTKCCRLLFIPGNDRKAFAIEEGISLKAL